MEDYDERTNVITFLELDLLHIQLAPGIHSLRSPLGILMEIPDLLRTSLFVKVVRLFDH